MCVYNTMNAWQLGDLHIYKTVVILKVHVNIRIIMFLMECVAHV